MENGVKAATIVGVGAGIVFSLLTYCGPPTSTPQPADERLELVADAPGLAPVKSAVLGDVAPDDPIPAAGGAGTGRTEDRRPLVVTLRNPADEPATLTGVKLVVTNTFTAAVCQGSGAGGGVTSSLDYDFRFPNRIDPPWSRTIPQVFEVKPRSVDALSVTMGPELETGVGFLWRFSVYGVSTSGREAHWGDGVWSDYFQAADKDYWQYIIGDASPPATVSPDVRGCATAALADLRAFVADDDLVLHPGIEQLIDHYRVLAGS